MRSRLTFTLVILLFSVFGAFAQNRDLTLDKGVAKHIGIDNIYAKFSQAYRELDANLVADLYTSDAFYLVPGSDIKRGRKAILHDFAGFFDSTRSERRKLTISFQILERRVSGNLGYDVGIYTLSNTNTAGMTSSSKGKFVVIALKEKTGLWRFQLDTYSDLAVKVSPQLN